MLKLALTIIALDVFRFIYARILAKVEHVKEFEKDDQIEFWQYLQAGVVGIFIHIGVFAMCAIHWTYNHLRDKYAKLYSYVVVYNEFGTKVAEGFALDNVVRSLRSVGLVCKGKGTIRLSKAQLPEKPLGYLETVRRANKKG